MHNLALLDPRFETSEEVVRFSRNVHKLSDRSPLD